MIKYIVLLFNLIGLFLYQLFFQTNVTATQSVPASADAGSSFVVEVNISKADVSGFAKYQEDLPKGFTAVAVEKQGATVLSSDNAIKFIWASLPSEPTIKISFRITVDASVAGSQPLSGKFLYVVNNERQEADVPVSNITINGTATPVATNTVSATPDNTTSPTTATPDNTTTTTTTTPPVTTTPDNTTATTTTAPPVTTTPDNSTPPTTTTTTTPALPVTISVSASRTLSATSVAPASDITVSVTVHKGTLSGFAKLEETLPSNVIASEGDKQGASFTFVDNKVKFVWLSLPADSVFTVSYKLTPGSTVSGDQSVTGEFSYLQDNNAAKYVLPISNFTVQNTSQPVTTATTAPDNTQTTTTTPPVTTTTPPDNTQTTATTPPVTTTTPPDNTQTTTTTPPVTTTTPPDNTQTTTTTPPVTTTTPPDNTQTTATTPPVTTTTPPDNTQTTATTPPATTTTPPDNTQTTTATPPVTTTPPVSDMTNVVTPHITGSQGGVMYRVQIMALHNAVKPSYLSGKFRISESISEEMVEGYTKYTVGHFDEYKLSRDHREEIKNKGVAGPFVVAYNDGKRITVQEALMITHQQWYK